MTSKNLEAGEEEERLTTCLPVGWHKNFFEKAEHAQKTMLLPSLQESWGYPEAIPVDQICDASWVLSQARTAISTFEPVQHLEPSIPKLRHLSFLLDMTLNWCAQEFTLSHAWSGAHGPLTHFLSYMVLCKLPKPNPYRPFVQGVWVCCLYFLCPPYLLHVINLSPPLEEKQESTPLQGETFANLGDPTLHNRNTIGATAASQRWTLRWIIRKMFHVKINRRRGVIKDGSVGNGAYHRDLRPQLNLWVLVEGEN